MESILLFAMAIALVVIAIKHMEKYSYQGKGISGFAKWVVFRTILLPIRILVFLTKKIWIRVKPRIIAKYPWMASVLP